MLYIAVCDDEITICEQIAKYIKEYSMTYSDEIHVDIFKNGEDLHDTLKRGQFFDLIFLDIELYHLSGIEIGTFIRTTLENQLSQIVYISFHQKYAMELFITRPLDFLLKPVTALQVASCIDLTKKIKQISQKCFTYQTSNIIKNVPLYTIYYFESNARKIKIVHTDGEDEFYGKIDIIEEGLKAHSFLRIHKSFLVNYMRVKSSKPTEITLDNGNTLPVSKSKQKEIMSILVNIGAKGIIKRYF